MRLFHGTSERHIEKILKDGLAPRSVNGNTNWAHSINSDERNVYLTTTYAGYFAVQAIGEYEEERLAIIEVDTPQLFKTRLYPDEDFIGQAVHMLGNKLSESNALFKFKGKTLLEITQEVVDNASMWKGYWKDSLKYMGTVAHRGTIPKTQIKKIALSQLNGFTAAVVDPCIAIVNFKFMRGKYDMYTRILMGEKITWQQFKKADMFLQGMDDTNEICKRLHDSFHKGMAELKVEIIKP